MVRRRCPCILRVTGRVCDATAVTADRRLAAQQNVALAPAVAGHLLQRWSPFFRQVVKLGSPVTGKRKRYGAEFKVRVALEALRGELTAAQLAAKHGVQQTMVGEWKKQAVEGLASVFSGKEAA